MMSQGTREPDLLIGLALWSWKGAREKMGGYAKRQVAVDGRGGSGKRESHCGFVLPATAPAHHSTVITGSKGKVTAHTGSQERQGNKCQPPEAKLLVASVARARVRVVSLGVRHTVI